MIFTMISAISGSVSSRESFNNYSEVADLTPGTREVWIYILVGLGEGVAVCGCNGDGRVLMVEVEAWRDEIRGEET